MTRSKGLLICSLGALFVFYEYILQVLPSTTTVYLMRDLQINAVGLGLLSSCFYLPYVLVQLPSGYCVDKFGPRVSMVFAISICALGSLLFGLSSTLPQTMAARLLMGLGGAFSIITTFSLISKWMPSHWFGFCAGMVQVTCCLGAISSQSLLIYLYDISQWPTIHLHMGWLGLIGAMLFALIIPKQNRQPKPTAKPILFNPFKEPLLYLMACILMCSWAPIVILASLWGAPLTEKIYAVEPAIAAHASSFIWIGMAVGSPLLGWLARRHIEGTSLMIMAALLAATSACLLLYAPLAVGSLPIVMFLIGFSVGVQPVCFDYIQQRYPQKNHGIIFGFLNMGPLLGGFVFQPLLGLFLNLAWDGSESLGVPIYSASDFQKAFSVMPLFGALMLPLITLLKFNHKLVPLLLIRRDLKENEAPSI